MRQLLLLDVPEREISRHILQNRETCKAVKLTKIEYFWVLVNLQSGLRFQTFGCLRARRPLYFPVKFKLRANTRCPGGWGLVNKTVSIRQKKGARWPYEACSGILFVFSVL